MLNPSNSTELDVSLSAANDQAVIAPSGSNISVSGTGYSIQSFSGVASLVVLGANTSSLDVPSQSVTFGGSGGTISLHSASGSNALNISGVTSVTFTDVTLQATSGDVYVSTSETTSATNPLGSTTYAPQASVSVTGAAIKADNVTLEATASATETTNGLLGGSLNSSGVAAATADLTPNATVTVLESSNITVNGTAGNITIGAVASASVASTPTVTSSLLPADAVIATSIVDSTAVAHVGGSTVSAGTTSGTLSITSTNTTNLTTSVSGSGASGGGGSVAVAIDNSTTQAYVDGGSSAGGGTVNVSATATNTVNTTATSTAMGADSNSGTSSVLSGNINPNNPSDTAPPAQTSDGPVSIAGAVAVTQFTPTTQAFVDSSAVTAANTINIIASSDNNTATAADGSATNNTTATSVGVAVAINQTEASNTAMVESTTGTASLSAPTICVQSTTPTASMSDVHSASTSATAGASGSNIGVAGALALNFVSNTSTASIPAGATVSIGSSGNVTFNAQDSITEAATALPESGSMASGGKVGVGASLALNIATNTTQANLGNTAQLTGAHNLTLTANSTDTMFSNATAGASGGVAVSPAVAFAIANNTTTAQFGTGSTLNLGGSLSVMATHAGSTTTTGGGTVTGTGSAAVGSSISQAIATDLTLATTQRNIAAGGAVSFVASATGTSAANAMASAAGGPTDNGAGGGTQGGSTVGNTNSENAQQRNFANSEGDSAGAGDSSNSAATPSASTSDGDVSVAAAVSVNIADSEADATIPDGLSVTSGGVLTVSAQNTTSAISAANGTASGTAKVGVGAAVALNLVQAQTLGAIGAGTTISATALTVQAQMNNSVANTFGASATAGAGSSDVGVAGAVGINLGSAGSQATIGQSLASPPITPGAMVTITSGGTGAVMLTAEDDSTSTASALPATTDGASGDSVGVGAGLGLNIVTNSTQAALANNVSMTGAGALALSATSTDTMTTTATTGAASTGGVATSAAVAVSIANSTTTAQLGSNDTTAVGPLSIGSLSATATHTGSTTSTAGGTAAGSSAAIGASVAMNIPTDQTTATTLSSLKATGALSFLANASGTSAANAMASAAGGPTDNGSGGGTQGGTTVGNTDSQNTQQRNNANSEGDSAGVGDSSNSAATPSASTSDGEVSVAAAVSVNIADSQANATIPSGLSITSTGGALTVSASNTTSASSTANGNASGNVQTGVGAAVALNLVAASDEATIQASTVSTKGVTVQAGMTGSGTPVNAISASATSGAGSNKVGVAGSLAINIVNDTSEALIETGVSVAAGGGAVSVTSLNNSTDTALAVPATNSGASGSSVGVGASLALNVISDTTESEVQNGASLTGAGSVTVTACSPHTITTTAQNGAAGATAVGAGIAIVIASDQTTASIGSDTTTLNATGGLTITASGSFTVNSEADANAADSGGSVGVGATLVLNVAQDAFLAELGRSVSAGGPISITAPATGFSQTTAIASEKGASPSGTSSSPGSNGTADQETQNQSSYAHTEGGSNSPNVPAPPTSNSEMTAPSSSATTDSGGSSGQTKTGIAAAVSVNVLTTSTVAEIDPNNVGLPVTTTSGTLTVGTTNQTSALALGDGRATTNQNSIGAALAMNVANVTNNATIGSSDRISAHGVNVTALMTSGQVNDFSAQGLGVAIGTQVGIAGSVGINVITIDTQASIGAGTTVESFGGLSVQARNDETLQNYAFTLAEGSDAGAGAAVNVNVLTNTTGAFLDSNVQANVADLTQVTAESSLNPSTNPVPSSPDDTFIPTGNTYETTLNSYLNSLHPTNFSAGAGASAGGAGVAGSFIVNVINQTTQAYLNNGDSINTLVGTSSYPTANSDEGVTVSATETMSITDWAGAVGGGDDAGVGAALDVDIVTEDAQADIASNATVDAAQNVIVTSSTNGSFYSVTAAVGLGASTGIAGAASIEILTPTTNACIGSGTMVNAQGDLQVQASRQATINTLAGQLSASGTASVGAAVSTIVDTVNTDASINSNDQITARGTSGTIPVLTGNSPGATTAFSGVAVVAATFENVQAIVLGGAVSGSVGIAGSVSVNVLNDTTWAYVAAGANVNATDSSPGSGPGVMVTASDPLTLFSTAGVLAGGGDVGLGVGTDVDTITRNTQAYIAAATVSADSDVLVQAQSMETITSITAVAGLSGSVAIAGSAGVYVLGITTEAYIGSNANVQASGSILVGASETTALYLLSGNFTGSGVASIGAAASVPVITKTTEAFIGAGAQVGALGLGSAIQAENGQFTTSYQSYGTAPGVVDPVSNPNVAATTTATPGGESLDNPRFTQALVATPESQSIHGLAVTAVNADNLQGVGVTGGASGAVAVNLSGSVAVLTNNTEASIGSSAKINSSNAGAASGQSVLVAAGNNASFLGIAAAISISGVVAVAPGAVVVNINNTTTASIADGASVAARGDVAVVADSSGNVLTIAAAAAVSGAGSAGGSVSYVGINDTTQANIGDSATSAATGAQVNAGGNVLVDATDATEAYMITGSLAIGVSGAGIGGAVGIVDLSKSTDAFIGNYATVNALGNSPSLSGIFDGNYTASGGFETLASFNGVAVQAATSENVTNVSAAGAAGFFAGLAGGVSDELFYSTTQAYIGNNAQINVSSTGPSTAQAVNVAAVNQASNFSFAGGLAGGIAGIAGGVDVGLLQNSTQAYIGNGSVVDANQDVDVYALSNDSVQSDGLGAAVGIVGLVGSVSVWTIGVPYSADYSDANASGASEQAVTNGGITTTSSSAESQTGAGSSMVGSLTSSNNSPANSNVGGMPYISDTASSNMSGVNNSIIGDPVANAIESTVVPLGTVAFIGSSVSVNAGGNVNVQAQRQVSCTGFVGGLSAGVVGIGGSVEIVNIEGSTLAYIDDNSTVSAGGNVTVNANLAKDTSNGTAFAGTVGIVGLGAQVVDIQDSSTESATLNSSVTIPQAQQVQVTAEANRSLTALAIGGTIGGIVAGVSEAIANATGGTSASIGSGDQIGQTGTVGSINVAATSIDTVKTQTFGIAVSLVSVQYNLSQSNDNPNVVVDLDDNSKVSTTGNVTVAGSASGKVQAETDNINVGGVVSIGLMESFASYTPYVESYVGSGAVVNAGGSFTLSTSSLNPTNEPVSTTAETSGGGVISGQGTIASSTSSSTDLSHICGGARVTAGNNLTVSASGSNSATSDAEGTSGGLISVASVYSSSTVSSQTTAQTDDATAAAPTYLNAPGTISFLATSTNTIDNANAAGGSGGLVATGDAESVAVDSNPTTLAQLGNYTIINGGSHNADAGLGHLEITVQNNANIQSVSYQNVDGAIAANSTSSTAQVNGSQTNAQVGQDVSANVNAIDITASDGSMKVSANSTAIVGDVYGNNAAYSYADLNGNVGVNLNVGSNLTAATNVNITASVGSATTRSITNCTSYGVDGTLTSNAESTKDDNPNITADSGSSITGQDTTVTASLPSSTNNGYTKTAGLTDDELVNAVTNAVVDAIEAVLRVLSLNGLLFNYHRTADQCASQIDAALGDRQDQETPGSQDLNSSINFNANVTILGPPAPTLVIDSAGKVTQDVGISATDGTNPLMVGSVVTSGQVVVNNLDFMNPYELMLSVPGGTLSGHAVVADTISYSAITISNASASTLTLNNINAYAGSPTANIVKSASVDTWGYDLETSLVSTAIDIENSSSAGGSITLGGHISNDGGQTTIHAAAGNIVSPASTSYVSTRLATLVAEKGQIGAPGTGTLYLTMDNGIPTLPSQIQNVQSPIALQRAASSTGVYLDMSLISILGSPTLLVRNVTAATGNINIKVENAMLDGSTTEDEFVFKTNSTTTTIIGTELSDTFDPSTAVGTNNGIITLPFPHVIYTGEQVTYSNGGGSTIGELTNGGTYTLKVLSSTSVELMNTFDPSTSVTWGNDIITFSSPHGLSEGDQLIYDNNNGPTIGGLTNGTAYYVRVIDPYTIKLATNPIDAGVPFDFNAMNVDSISHTISLASPDGMATGQPLTYTSSGTPLNGLTAGTTYYAIVVNSTTIQLADTAQDAQNGIALPIGLLTASFASANVDSTENSITFNSTQALATGQAVTYSTSGTAVNGLTSGTTYFVIDQNATTIQLASSPTNAQNGIALPISPATLTDNFTPANVDGNAYTITFGSPHNLTPGEALTYSTSGSAINGLTPGTTYYVIVVNSTEIQLASSLTNAQIGNAIGISPGSGAGTQTLTFSDSAVTQTLTLTDPRITQTLTPAPYSFNVGSTSTTFASTNVDGTAHTITFASPTGLQTGDDVVYSTTGNPLTGLTSGTTYSVIAVNSTTIQLADLGGTVLNIGPALLTPSFAGASVNGTAHSITLSLTASTQVLTTGEAVQYTTTGIPVTGLTSGTTYYVTVVSSTATSITIQLASSLTNAQNGIVLPIGPESDNFTPSNVDGTAFTITFGSPSGLTNGEAVTYTTSGTAISGLTSGTTYYVINATSTTVQLASTPIGTAIAIAPGSGNGTQTLTFADPAVTQTLTYSDPSVTQTLSTSGYMPPSAIGSSSMSFSFTDVDFGTSSITIPSSSPLQTGDDVVYTASGGSIYGLISGTTYYAIRVDSTDIQLATTIVEAENLQYLQLFGYPPSNQSNTLTYSDNTIHLGYNPGFTTGEPITYNTTGNPISNVDNVAYNFTPSMVNIPVITLSDIGLMSTGDEVYYSTSGTPVTGLTNNTAYYVIKLSSSTIQLATSENNAKNGNALVLTAGSGSGTQELEDLDLESLSTVLDPIPFIYDFQPSDVVDGTNNTITFPSGVGDLITGDAVVYSIANGGTAVSGLTAGTTYYVTVVNPTTIQLALSSGGTILTLGAGASGTQTLTENEQDNALTPGFTYYAIKVDNTDYQLADNPYDAMNGIYLHLSISGASGPQTLGVEGVNLTVPGYHFSGKSGSSTINLVNPFNPDAPDGFSEGQPVTYLAKGTPISGLTSGTTYYVNVVSTTSVELAASSQDLNSNTYITLHSAPTSTDFLVYDPVSTLAYSPALTFTNSDVNSSNNTINFGAADGYSTGEAVIYETTGTPVGGLTSGQVYYVKQYNNSTTTIQLSASPNGSIISLDATNATGMQSLDFYQDLIRDLVPAPSVTAAPSSLLPVSPADQYIYITDNEGNLNSELASTLVSETLLYSILPGSSNSVVAMSNVVATTGNLTITAGSGTTYQTNIQLAGTVGSPAGTTTLTTPAGYVQDVGGTLDVQAMTASLQAGNTIGTAANPLSTQIQTVSGSAIIPGTSPVITVSFTPANVNVGNTITFSSPHGLKTGEALTYTSTGNLITGLSLDTDYYVIYVNPNTIQLASSPTNAQNGVPLSISQGTGSGNQTLTFTNSFSTTQVSSSTITFSQPHGLTTGEAVIYSTSAGGSAMNGLALGNTYYVIYKNSTAIQLASSLTNAQNGIAVTITGNTGSGTQYLSLIDNFTPSQVSVPNLILFPSPEGLNDGDAVKYSTTGTASNTGLTNGNTYYVIYVNSTTIQLAASLDGPALNVRPDSAGSTQTLTCTAGWYMNNTGNLTVGNLTTTGTNTGVSTTGDVILKVVNVVNSTTQVGSVVVTPGTSIVSNQGQVYIQATGDISSALGTTITAVGPVSLIGDSPNINRPTLINLSGSIHGSTNYVTGGPLSDSVVSTNPENFVLTNSSLSRYNGTVLEDSFVLQSIEKGYLTDTSSTGGHSFDVSGWTQTGGLTNNSSNTDTLIITKPVAVTVTNTLATAADGMVMGLTGPIHTAQITDTTGGHTINVSSWTGTATLLDTGTTPDTLTATRNADMTLTNSSLTTTDGLSLTLSGFNSVYLLTTGTSHAITVSGWTGTGTVGSTGTVLDSIVAAQSANFTLTNSSLVTTAGTSLTLVNIGFAYLTDTTGGHTFNVSGWTGGGSLTNNTSTPDTLLVTKSASVTLSNLSLTATDGESLRLIGKFGTAQLVDPAGGHTFTVGGWTGGGSLTSNGTADTVAASKSSNFTLTNSLLSTSDGMLLSLSKVTTANLTDTGGGHTFTISGWTGTGSLINLAGTADTIVVSKNASYTLTNSTLSSSDGMVMTLTGLMVVNLTDTGGNHTFDVSGWTGQGALVDTSSSKDTLNATKNAGYTLTNASLKSTDGMSIALSGFGIANLKDTGGNHTIDVGAWTGTGSIVNTGGVTDGVAATKNGNFTLADTLFCSSDGMSLVMSGVKKATLTDTGSGHAFTVSGWTGTASLICSASSGTDTVYADKKGATFKQTATTLTDSIDTMSLTFTSNIKTSLSSS